MGEPLVLQVPQPAWWDRFRDGIALPERVAGPVWSRWTRARDLGAPLEEVHPELGLVRGAELRERQERLAPLLHEGRELLADTGAAVAEHDFSLLLADPDGILLRAVGGGEFAAEARRVRLIEGACWTEAMRGTNAIGTAIAEARPVAVHGSAHYTRVFHDLVCYAAPVRDLDGNVVAVLDATSRSGRADPAVATMVSAVALALEAMGRSRAWASAGLAARALIERTLDRVTEPAVIVERPGRIIRCNAAARVAFGSGRAPFELRAALGVEWDDLLEAPTRTVPRFGASGPCRVRVEPLLTAEGRVGALAVFVDRAPTLAASEPRDAFAAVYAEDGATRAAVDLGRRMAKSDLPIVLLAETGTGKERFAAALHAASPRKDGPFVAVNCGSFAPELLAAELFGYAPGSFTGADRQGREGLLHAAEGGTLFLDEIGEMPPAMQVALLRVLEDGGYERVGERARRKANVRVICATCKDLPKLVESGAFRQDLWFRIKGVVLRLPPLRDRADRVGLARFLLAQARPDGAPALDPGLEAWIRAYPWPGNVRELKSVLEVALVLADGARVLTVNDLPPDLETGSVAGGPAEALQDVEVWAIQRALEACAGNVSAAARRLGVARSTIYRVLERAGLR